MAHPNPLVREAASLLGDDLLMALARDAGFLVRQRSLQVVPFFWTLVLGMIASPVKSLAGVQRLYHERTGITLASSSFQGRFNAALVDWMRAAFEHATAAAAAKGNQRHLAGALAAFRELSLIDSTILRLNDHLAGRYPGPRTNHSPAAAKLNVIYNIVSGRIAKARVTEGTRAETKLFQPGPWVADTLLLFDLGYFKLQTFWRIVHHRGSFISRLKDGANPTIVAANIKHRGQSITLVGRKLKDVLGSLKRQTIDCQVEYRVPRKGMPGRPPKDGRKTEVLILRLVGVLNEETGEYHLYLTNVPPTVLSARAIAETYRLRWHVELLFKELRSVGGLDEWPNRKEEVVLATIYATMLGMLVNRRLMARLRDALEAREGGEGRRISPQRWTMVFAAHAMALLDLILGNAKQGHQQVKSFMHMLLREAVEPMRRKPRLAAQHGF